MKFKYLSIIFAFSLFFAPANGFSEMLFQDDFESDSSNWSCGSGQLSKWDNGWMECGYTAGFGFEWKMGPGRNGGNAVYSWKKNILALSGYRSESMKWFEGTSVKREIYHRWYMKFPSKIDKVISDGFKFWRYVLRANGNSGPPEIYLNMNPGSGSRIIGSPGFAISFADTSGWIVLPSPNWRDGNWHCHELRMKLNDSGQSNGILQYWMDGVLRYSNTSLDWKARDVNNCGFHRFGVGIGNTTESNAFEMTDWTGIGFDDVAVSTSYIGPGGDTGSPAPPGNLRIIN